MRGVVPILGLCLAIAASRAAEPPVQAEKPVFVVQLKSIGLGEIVAPENFTLAALNAALVKETNRVRALHHCRALKSLRALAEAADDHTAFMAMTFTVSHTSPIPGEESVVERTRKHGLDRASLIAENILSTSVATPSETADACAEIAALLIGQWMDSPGHRANLLNPNFTDLGCAARRVVFPGGGEKFFATQVFAAR